VTAEFLIWQISAIARFKFLRHVHTGVLWCPGELGIMGVRKESDTSRLGQCGRINAETGGQDCCTPSECGADFSKKSRREAGDCDGIALKTLRAGPGECLLTSLLASRRTGKGCERNQRCRRLWIAKTLGSPHLSMGIHSNCRRAVRTYSEWIIEPCLQNRSAFSRRLRKKGRKKGATYFLIADAALLYLPKVAAAPAFPDGPYRHFNLGGPQCVPQTHIPGERSRVTDKI